MNERWKTNDGRIVDIRWMDSAHLINSFNMLARKAGINEEDFVRDPPRIDFQGPLGVAFKVMLDEVKARDRFYWTPEGTQLIKPLSGERESIAEMCMLRAVLDIAPQYLNDFYDNRPGFVAQVVSDKVSTKLLAKFTEYRLAR